MRFGLWRGLRTACAAAVVLAATPVFGFSCLDGNGGCIIWQPGQATLSLFLGNPGGQLSNGTFSWDENAAGAAFDWNNIGTRFQFSPRVGEAFLDPCGPQGPQHACPNTGPIGNNPVYFTPTICGRGFGDALALTVNCFDRAARDMVNAPVFVRQGERWDAYDGPLRGGVVDLRRVLGHEFGHVLGLLHPDDDGQNVVALMNSRIGNIDRPQGDDVDGIRSLYSGIIGTEEERGCAMTTSGAPSAWWWLGLAALLLKRGKKA